jgi:hypothetical protein
LAASLSGKRAFFFFGPTISPALRLSFFVPDFFSTNDPDDLVVDLDLIDVTLLFSVLP